MLPADPATTGDRDGARARPPILRALARKRADTGRMLASGHVAGSVRRGAGCLMPSGIVNAPVEGEGAEAGTRRLR
jgi:hypothetical protein